MPIQWLQLASLGLTYPLIQAHHEQNRTHQQIAEKADLTKKDSEKALNAFIETVTETLKARDEVQLVGFGNFQVKPRAAREGRNPQTGKIIQIAATNIPSFKAGKTLKEAVN